MKTKIAFLITGLFIISIATANAQRVVVRKTNHKAVVVKKKPVKRTTVIRYRTLPKHHVSIVHNKVNYYYVDGAYYSIDNGAYVKVKAPIGIVVATLPVKAKRIVVNDKVFWVHNNVYYRNIPGTNRYKVVRV